MPLHRTLLLALLALVLAGCSRVQFGYSQAERVLAWALESYLPLERRQSEALGRQLADFKQWHCRSQLPGYAAWMRGVGQEAAAGVSAAQVEARYANVRYFLRLMAEEASPRFAELARALEDRQLDDLESAFDKANGKYRREFVDVAYKSVVSERAAKTRERLEAWTGPLTREQRQIVDRWSAALEPAQADILESRRRWQRSLREALTNRGDPAALRSRLFVLMAEPERTYTPSLTAKLEANRARTFGMVAEVSAQLTEAQKRRVVERTQALAAELEAIACPVPTRTAALP
jgi:hypothetical protein